MALIDPGEVWLVGAGPGDPDLLTRKAEALIRAADIVFHDALVGMGVLELVPPHVELVCVGKRSGRHSKSQAAIDTLIVEAALTGKRVVRLKGGDPAIFGRATEELEACRTAGILVYICPGITAASAAAASLGCSLTLRGFARRLTLVTAHLREGGEVALDWKALADPEAMLAIYMGKAAARALSAGLIDAGLAPSTPVAVIENASLPQERHFIGTLGLLPLLARTALKGGPALILVGPSVSHSAPIATQRQMLKPNSSLEQRT
ncbi:uroporphyrinogen-III C-methyltransferase [Erythrobacter mangrovi]|uniref:uroporphyrinogen-III C-methyltransferase n=1 Tax=Erythrobacter mangrovi TaxID=2739433 RepID=A0A7D3XC71_9SPHN|nr:uroporphyrinogen-III C-methyltransferase [Erythrobacter mangrovi]QKG72190.1 uroporphyrinogen-III C-methyltransferase [Erythrobacter mangrovi]